MADPTTTGVDLSKLSPEEQTELRGYLGRLTVADTPMGLENAAGGGLKTAGVALRNSALPIAGQVVGGMAGAAAGTLFPPTAPVLANTGRVLGAMGGEKANQMLGWTPESTRDVLLSGAVPLGANVAINTAKDVVQGFRAVPGIRQGITGALERNALALPDSVRPGTPSKAIYAVLDPALAGASGQEIVPLGQTQQLIRHLRAQMPQDVVTGDSGTRTTYNTMKTTLDRLEQMAEAQGGLPLREAYAQLGQVQLESDAVPALGRLRDALKQDINALANRGSSAAGLVVGAAQSYRLEKAAEQVSDIVGKTLAPGGRGLIGLPMALQYNERLADRLGPEAHAALVDQAKTLAEKVPSGMAAMLNPTTAMTLLLAGGHLPGVPAAITAPLGKAGLLALIPYLGVQAMRPVSRVGSELLGGGLQLGRAALPLSHAP